MAFTTPTYKHKMIKDVTYTVIGTSKTKMQLRESGTNREFWITRSDFTQFYDKK